MGKACNVITVWYSGAVFTSLECAGGWTAECRQNIMTQRKQIVLLCMVNAGINNPQGPELCRWTHETMGCDWCIAFTYFIPVSLHRRCFHYTKILSDRCGKFAFFALLHSLIPSRSGSNMPKETSNI